MAVFEETIRLNDQVTPAAKSAGEAVDGLAKKATGVNKPLTDVGTGLTEVGSSAGGASTELAAVGGVMLSVVAAAGAVAYALGAIIVAGAQFAIQANEEKQAMLGLFDAMAGGAATGEETEAMIDGLKERFGVAKGSLIQYTNELHRMGITDLGQLEGQLLAVASAGALVKGGDQALLNFTKKIELAKEAGIGLKIPVKGLAELSATGVNVGDVANKMGISVAELTKNLKEGTVNADRFGEALNAAIVEKGQGPLERMASSSANLKKLLSESIGDLFEDIDVGPFMQQVKELFDIFSQGKPSGQALKAGIGGFFKDVFASATKVVPLVKHFLLDMVIYGLKAYIALKPLIAVVKGIAADPQTMTTLTDGFKALGVVAVTVVGALGLVLGVIGLMVYGISTVVADLYKLGVAFNDVSQMVGAFVAGAAGAAYDFIAGLVGGIASGTSLVTGAVSSLAKSALSAFTGSDGIDAHSPSRKMIDAGLDMGEGVVVGTEQSEGDVYGASSNMAAAAVEGAATPTGGASTGAAAGGGGSPITVYVQVDGAGKSALEITEEMVSNVFQRMALGAGV